MKNISSTEYINENTQDIDLQDSLGIVSLINQEDMLVAQSIQKVLPEIAQGVDFISKTFLDGGRLFYFGAGTSGRLGVLDASECPPTFGVSSDMVKGVIAGGDDALRNAIEGAEDSVKLAKEDFCRQNISKTDTIVVISASGNANYVVEIQRLAKALGCKTIALTSNVDAKIKYQADCFICVETGAEAISGSTRLKAGTAQKMVLNMLTTASMVKIGKVYKNLMIDVQPTNEKLKNRAVMLVSEIAEVEESLALNTLIENDYNIKHAVLRLKYNISKAEADQLIKEFDGVLRKIFNYLGSKN